MYILLYGLKSIMKKKLWEKNIFLIKRLFEEIRVTHGESRGNSRRKHTLNKKTFITYDIVEKCMPLNSFYKD